MSEADYIDKFIFENRIDEINSRITLAEHETANVREKLEKKIFIGFITCIFGLMFFIGIMTVSINNQSNNFEHITKKLEKIENSQEKLENLYIEIIKEYSLKKTK